MGCAHPDDYCGKMYAGSGGAVDRAACSAESGGSGFAVASDAVAVTWPTVDSDGRNVVFPGCGVMAESVTAKGLHDYRGQTGHQQAGTGMAMVVDAGSHGFGALRVS